MSATTLLVVDDAPENLQLLSALLSPQYRVKVANSGIRALGVVALSPPDLILLDVMMPEMDGLEVLRRLKADPISRDIPVILLTALTAAIDEQEGLEAGAIDYLTKPISPPLLLARVHNHLQLKAAQDRLRHQNEFLEEQVRARTRDIETLQDITIHTLASLAETRDNETGNHLRRTQHYVRLLAEGLQRHPHCPEPLDAETIQLLFKSAPLHDIGKVGIPDRILLKPGPLEPEEFELMKQHARMGREALDSAERTLGQSVPFLEIAKDIAGAHHEHWDGNGYPDGLAGTAIPLAGRLMALADVYDALISRRVYKAPFSHERAVEMISEASGTQFDPLLVEIFLTQQEQFRAIARQFADTASPAWAQPG